MNIMSFIRSMVPFLKKKDIIEDVAQCRASLVNGVIPSLKEMEMVHNEKPFIAAPFVNLNKSLRSKVHPSEPKTVFGILDKALTKTVSLIDEVLVILDKDYGEDISIDGITYRRANLLHFAAICNFVTIYTSRWMSYCGLYEATDNQPKGDDKPSRNEETYINNNVFGFEKAILVLLAIDSKLTDIFDGIADVTVNEDSAVTLSHATALTDPIRMGIIPLPINPFHFVGVRWATYRANVYRRMVEEKKSLELRLEQIRLRRRGQEDPRLEKQLAYYQNEVELLAAKISAMEND